MLKHGEIRITDVLSNTHTHTHTIYTLKRMVYFISQSVGATVEYFPSLQNIVEIVHKKIGYNEENFSELLFCIQFNL